MEINSVQLLIFFGIMTILLCIYIWELQKKITRNRELINKLVGQLEKEKNRNSELVKQIEKHDYFIDSHDKEIRELKSSTYNAFQMTNSKIDELFKLLKSEPVKECIGIKESESHEKAVQETDEEDINEGDESENRGITDPNRGIYEWIFPSKGVTEENKPKIGEEYLVIGHVRGADNIHSSFALWNGAVFKPSEHNCPFDSFDSFENVYAYFQLPSPSDVMNEVVDIVAKNGGV